MQLAPEHFYHLYNRTNNAEIAFRGKNNYLYFLKKYRLMIAPAVNTLAYILMPTHFHFLIQIKTEDIDALRQNIGRWQSSYTRAINKAYDRHGSLFQVHTKAIEIDQDSYLITLISYIHQNALRAGLAKELSEWPYSSFADLAGLRRGTLPDKKFVMDLFGSEEEFFNHSNEMLASVNKKYWV